METAKDVRCGAKINECPVYRTLRIIGRKWTLLILQELGIGKRSRRYNEIQKTLSWITPRVLSARLREMEGNGLIKRRIFPDEIPVRVEYSLTEKGRDLQRVISEMRKWGFRWG